METMKIRTRKVLLKLVPPVRSCPKCGGELEPVTNGYRCVNNDWSLIIKNGKVRWYQKVLMFINGYKALGGAIIWGAGSIVGLPWLAVIGEVITYGGGVHKAVKLAGKVKNKISAQEGRSVDWIEIIKSIINFIKHLISKGGN